MDPRVMELRIKQWIPIIEEQSKSGLNKTKWFVMHDVDRTTFFRWQKRVRAYLLDMISHCCYIRLPQPSENTLSFQRMRFRRTGPPPGNGSTNWHYSRNSRKSMKPGG